MTEPRKPGKKRDPRMDTDPPAPDSATERALRQRKATQNELHAVAANPPAIRAKDPQARMTELEAELVRERAERAAEADLMGQILARATQAEARVKILEATLARVNEERTLAESQLQTVRGELEGLLASQRSTYAQQTSSLDARSDSKPQLRAMRSLTLELLQVLEGVLGPSTSERPLPPSSRPKQASDRPRGSDRPGRTPTLRPRANR